MAVVLARKRLAGEKMEDCDSVEFDVVELADTMGWQLPLVKRGLRQLQWGGTYRFSLHWIYCSYIRSVMKLHA